MLGFRYSYKHLEDALENMKKIIKGTEVEKFIVDHHLLRDIKWRERIKDIYKLSEEGGVKVLNAAEFIGEETSMLEARRRELYKDFPP